MKHKVAFKSFEPDDKTRNVIERRIKKLEKKTRSFHSDSIFLRVFVEENSTRTLYNVSLTMDVPGKTLATKEQGHDLEATIKAAFDEIERQLQKHKVRQMKAEAAEDEERDREIFFQLVSPHLSWLDHFVGHLIRYSESMGELVRDELIPEEVVDGALIRAYRQFLKGHAVGDVRSWLTRLAVDRLDEEINRLAAEREIAPVHIEEDIPETPPKEWVSSLGEEIMYFYQPDEDLKVEDTVPDPEVTTPEDEVAAKELRDCVTAALHEMPWESQRALLMHYGEDEPITRVADTIGKPEEEVRRILRYSSKYLRQRLIESGCTLTPRRRAA